jgi:hypothetical protein
MLASAISMVIAVVPGRKEATLSIYQAKSHPSASIGFFRGITFVLKTGRR